MDNQNALQVQDTDKLTEYQEQSISMVQQREKAKIESRYIMALRQPRDKDLTAVRQKMLRECSRPSFCAPDMSKNGSSVAIYRIPRGSGSKRVYIEGVTIRFAEMAKRCYGHIFVEVTPLGEDETQQIYQVEATDYQNNDGGSEIVIVPKRIERSYAKDSDVVLSKRTNSSGETTFTIIPTDDELLMKRNALLSKARRNVIMACIDGWLVEECKAKIWDTAAAKDAENPGAAKTAIFDAFASIGVSAVQLNDYLGHADSLSPAELDELRSLYGGIKEGYTTWAEIAASKGEGKDDGSADRIEALVKELEYTPAQARTKKAKYAGRPKELIEWLEGEVAKKRNDGGKRESKTQEADTAKNGTTETSTSQSTEQKTAQTEQKSTHRESAEPEPQQDAKQSCPVEQEKPAETKKSAPPASDSFNNW